MLAVSGIALAVAQAAQAQTASAPPTEEVVVTALPSVTGSPLKVKSSDDAIVNAITAKEIDALPNASLADALERVPGVAIVPGYNSTRGRNATLRGFDSRYNSTEIDGNPIWNASRNNRGTQIDVFPSEVVNQVSVYATVLPDQDANSIGGHIEMRSLRAFDGGDQTYVKLRGEVGGYEQGSTPAQGGEPSYRASGVAKFTFGPDHAFGAVLGAASSRDRWYSKYSTVTAYSQLNGVDVVNGDLFPGVYDNRTETESLYAKLETRRADKLYGFLAVDYFRDRETDEFYRTGPFVTASAATNVGVGTGTFSKVVDESYLESYWIDRRTTLVSSGLDYRLDAKSALTARASYTNYDHHELDSTGDRFQYSTVSGSYQLSDTYPGVVLAADPNLSNPANWIYRNKAAQEKFIPDQDYVYSARLDYETNAYRDARGFGFKTGVFVRRLDRNFNQTVNSWVLPAGTKLTLAQVMTPGATVDGVHANFIDPSLYWGALYKSGVLTVDPSLTTDYHLVEDVYAGHAALYYTNERLRILAGFRVESTRSKDTTGALVGTVTTPVTNRIDYTNFMPNVQAQFELAKGLRLRTSYTGTIARPDFSDFAMGQTTTLDGNGYPVVKGTNPFLKPRESKNYDASLEYYSGRDYISLAVFHKDLTKEEFSEVHTTTNSAGVVILTEQTPLNLGSAKLDGLEISFAKDRFEGLPGPLADFGLSANYTYLQGRWNVVFSDGSRRTVDGLRNQPQSLANVTLSYRHDRFSADLSWRAQGRTFTGTFGTNAAGDIWIASYQRVDAQARFAVSDRLQVFAEVRNLGASTWRQFQGLNDSLNFASNPGRSGFVGLSYAF